MKLHFALLATLLSCSLGYSQAANALVVPNPAVPDGFFNAKEFSLDLYGTGSLSNADRDSDNIRFGAGLGANYFFTRGLGIGLRGESDNTGHSFVDRVKARALFRAPLWDRLAPYGFVEGGFNFERDDWGAGAGGGLEYRFGPRLGVFAEAGLEVDTGGSGLMRGTAGLRLTF